MRFCYLVVLVAAVAPAGAAFSRATQPWQVWRSHIAARGRSTARSGGPIVSSDSGAAGSATIELSLSKPLGLVLEEEDKGGKTGLFVAEVRDGGSAAASGSIKPGMQLVKVNGKAVSELEPTMDAIIAAEGPLTLVLAAAAVASVAAPKPPAPAPAPAPPPSPPPAAPPAKVSVGVRQEGKPDLTITAKGGAILRTELLAAKVDVYTMVGKMTNCGGVGQCGTCIVDVPDGAGCSPRTAVEQAKLKNKPATYRLACQTVLTGDTTVVTKPK
jgi:ferredoxin